VELRIAVLGAGPGGYIAAVRAAQMGARVTVVEKEALGGTCLNRGCIPSKIMKTTAALLERVKGAADFGVRCGGPVEADMPRLVARKNRIVASQVKGIQGLLAHHRIQVVHGDGRIEKFGVLSVHGKDGTEETIHWDRLIIATGSEPFALPGMPFDGERIVSSDHIWDLAEIPASMLIVGGGVIGCELAYIFSSLGSRVTVVEALDRVLPLPVVDEDCSKTLFREMKKRKIRILLNQTLKTVEKEGTKITALITPSPSAADNSQTKEVRMEDLNKVLVSVGRKPCTEGIGLENIGVKTDDRGWIIADERMETNISGVYAIGDVIGPDKAMLAHVASTEGRLAAENAGGGDMRMNYDVVPSVIFTAPEVACVGMSEKMAADRGLPVRAETVLFRTVGKAQVIGEIAGQAKVVFNSEDGKILGFHLVGPHVTDLIAEGTLAVKTGCRVDDIAGTIHAHPTLAEIMAEVALKAIDQPLHG
jgi:dihydrolipoamide dehydrogenase